MNSVFISGFFIFIELKKKKKIINKKNKLKWVHYMAIATEKNWKMNIKSENERGIILKHHHHHHFYC